MRDGAYGDNVDFYAFRVLRFSPHLFNTDVFGGHGCGASALALLTGSNPLLFRKRADWTPKIMLKILAENDIESRELTKRNLTDSLLPRNNIGGNHVLLASIKLIKREASWVVYHAGLAFHNFEVTKMGPYGWINQPLMTAFLLRHPSWMVE